MLEASIESFNGNASKLSAIIYENLHSEKR